jgi:hypothetical protein
MPASAGGKALIECSGRAECEWRHSGPAGPAGGARRADVQKPADRCIIRAD